jgi:hypothetical protein
LRGHQNTQQQDPLTNITQRENKTKPKTTKTSELLGTRLGDVVTGLNGRAVASERDLFAALDDCRCARFWG